MSETPDATVTDLPTQPNFWARNKSRLIKAGAVTGVVLVGGAYLKRKLNCSCDVDIDASVENADNPDN